MLTLLSDLLGEEVLKIESIVGGNIHNAYRLILENRSIFLKTSPGEQAQLVLSSEYKQLTYLYDKITGHIPKVIEFKTDQNRSFLFLEYLVTAHQYTDHRSLALLLDKLHKCSSEYFGWEEDNYIGILKQSNSKTHNLVDFISLQRWYPQIRMARDNGFLSAKDVQLYTVFLNNAIQVLPDDGPHLIHGDLWSGNYLQAQDGTYYLLDPALFYGHKEMDLAMMQLFGGFHNNVYEMYEEISGIDKNWKQRSSLFQLYPLLVHLNLFGTGYKPQVMAILNTYK